MFIRLQGSQLLIWRAWLQWRLLQEAIELTSPTHCLAMHIDHLLLPLSMGLLAGCDISGIYFRPTFHYSRFLSFSPSFSDRFRSLRQRIVVFNALKSPELKNLFCLDPYAARFINTLDPNNKAVALPDPVHIYDSDVLKTAKLKNKLNISSNKFVFLLFGAISKRKGVLSVLDAFLEIDANNTVNITLLLVGRIDPKIRTEMELKIKKLLGFTHIQIVICDYFVSEKDIQSYFELTDVVLTLYQRHVGMSGIIVLSAAMGKPVLSSDYGLLGEVVKSEGLGLTVDTSKLNKISEAISKVIKNEKVPGFDIVSARKFAAHNSAANYWHILFDKMFKQRT